MIMILRTTITSINFYSLVRCQIRNLAALVLLCSPLTACVEWLPDAHRIDLQQGNTVKLEQKEALEIGMSQAEVRRVMGEPMLTDPFHAGRWDYIYRYKPNKGFERRSLLTLYFEDDALVKIDDEEYIEP